VTHNIHASGDDGVDLAQIWTERTHAFGARCVVNLSYNSVEFTEVTQRQRESIFPLLQTALNGGEEKLLDFGCGPGRFSGDLAKLTGARVLGFDVCEDLIRLAPAGDNVEFRASASQDFFQSNTGKFDIVWVCLVLGGIPDSVLFPLADDLTQILNKGGLLFLVEHTSESKVGNNFWRFRSVDTYKALFPTIGLDVVGSYLDFGEEVSILSGRRRV